ncbi:hypothetical protein [Mycobacterium sp. URHB0044]|jgi:hypothetical protein|uniref:hypothetical protein n=1 Tax=Mycobacterium sp. URHB0044 TaxID=1380386 RepID=UPI0004914C8F|nr:hypothetical protein [Mycobacterium sp. URHB0044]
MDNAKFTKTVTMSLVALAAATGAAVLEAGVAGASPGCDSCDVVIGPGPGPVPIPYPNIGTPGLTIPAQKIEQKLPGLKVPAVTAPALKIAHKVPALKIPGVIHELPQSPILTEQQ